jgi:acyl-coenzyme A thioesterase PaaI-like protein
MLFSETLASIQPQDQGWSVEIGEDWTQGRATFGGMVAALGNEAMRRLVPSDRALRGLDITFVGPVLAGTTRIEAEVLRVGKAVTITHARLWSDAKVATTMTGIYGAARPVAIAISPPAIAAAPPVDDLPDSTLPPNMGGPAFLQHFGLRWGEGTRPFTGTPLNRSKAYIRHEDRAALTESAVVALIDVIPSPLLQMMTRIAPASSLMWNLEFISHDYSFPPDAWWRIDTEVNSAGDGYSSQSSVVSNPAGVPMAFSRQLVAVFG